MRFVESTWAPAYRCRQNRADYFVPEGGLSGPSGSERNREVQPPPIPAVRNRSIKLLAELWF
jgi:hypothetical protein